MAGEICIKLTTSGLTVKALLLNTNRTQRWNGSSMVAISSVADSAWATGMISCTEQTTSDGTGTKTYVGTFPSSLSAGEYIVQFYSGASPVPGDNSVGTQTIDTRVTAGAGSTAYTIAIQTGVALPVASVACWVSTDESGTNVVAGTEYTNAQGEVTFNLNTGTYWLWRYLASYSFGTNPYEFTVD